MENLYKLKEEFLNIWSLDRVRSMTLEEYTNLNRDDSFCYWLESRTTDLGGIGGGSAYKFGIYKRSDLSRAVEADNRKTDGEYAWFTKYGANTKEEAFESVKGIIIDIIECVKNNRLERIDKIDLGAAYKWKIAFLYSDFNIINIFKYEALKFLALGKGFDKTKRQPISEYQKFLMNLKSDEEDYFTYAHNLWREYEDSLKRTESISVNQKQLFINWLISSNLDPEIAEDLESLSDDVLAKGYFSKPIYDCTTYDDVVQLSFQDPISENWNGCYEHYNNFVFTQLTDKTGIDLFIKYGLVTVSNRAEFEKFTKNNYWSGDNKKAYEQYVNGFHKDSRLAIYSRINKNQIKIGALGTVINNPNNGFELKVEWDSDFESFTVDLICNPGTLDFYEIQPYCNEDENLDIKNIFYNIKPKVNCMTHPLNQILYGAPGTGKTYNTKRLAVEIIDGLDYSKSDRNTVLKRYQELYSSKQINFTTFHQSSSYEDFIEGIKPVLKSDDDNDDTIITKDTIEYEIKDGLFKNLCRLAEGVSGNIEVVENFDFQNKNFYKMSLGGKNHLEKHNWSIKNNLVFLGWGRDKDFTKLKDIKDWKTFRDTFKKEFPELVEDSKFVIQAVYAFQNMKIGDVVVITKGNNVLDAIGIIESEYFYDDSQEIDHYQFRKVKWLATNMNASPQLFIDKNISQQAIYQFYNDDVKIDVFNENFKKENKKAEHKKYVLIIDEINRGNISSIFGELITLLEDDKRKGILKENKEAIEVELPYSDDKFSVPDNLYIIGTMNTADRSVESLDTALRRRFSFVEMYPNSEILKNEHDSKGIISNEEGEIDLVQLLETINGRIEILIDKDHKIGHSFFINTKTFQELKLVFKDKVIPLLEEYFFGDFGKVGLVLGKGFIEKADVKDKVAFADFDHDDKDILREKAIYLFSKCADWKANDFIQIYK
ncbi:AAA family ATPase [Flavobacterium sp. 83]|uniref:AAA family ATPase n=1 Tax=Flavobacterium sp. 83 TaxID=1131812 RepID=UPI00068E5165|nr:AAA family ATPase [Flavobacterium sp. 83]